MLLLFLVCFNQLLVFLGITVRDALLLRRLLATSVVMRLFWWGVGTGAGDGVKLQCETDKGAV